MGKFMRHSGVTRSSKFIKNVEQSGSVCLRHVKSHLALFSRRIFLDFTLTHFLFSAIRWLSHAPPNHWLWPFFLFGWGFILIPLDGTAMSHRHFECPLNFRHLFPYFFTVPN